MTQQELHALMTAIIYAGALSGGEHTYFTAADATNAATKCFKASAMAFTGEGGPGQ